MTTTRRKRDERPRPDRSARPAGRGASRAGIPRLGADRRGPRHPRPPGRDGPLRRRVGGERLRVRPGSRAGRSELRRRGRLRAPGRRPLAGPGGHGAGLPEDGGPRGAGAAARSRRRPVVPPQPGVSVSPDGHTAVIRAGAAADANEMVDAAERLKTSLAGVAAPGVAVDLTGRLGHVVGLQRGEPRRDAQVRAHLLAGDDGHPRARLRFAGGRGAAADADHRRAGRLRGAALPRNALSRRSRSGR